MTKHPVFGPVCTDPAEKSALFANASTYQKFGIGHDGKLHCQRNRLSVQRQLKIRVRADADTVVVFLDLTEKILPFALAHAETAFTLRRGRKRHADKDRAQQRDRR